MSYHYTHSDKMMTEVVVTVTYAGEPQNSVHPFVIDAASITFKDLKTKVSFLYIYISMTGRLRCSDWFEVAIVIPYNVNCCIDIPLVRVCVCV